MTTISPTVEALAAELIARIDAVLDSVDQETALAAIEMAARIKRERAAKNAEMLDAIGRLVRATNCPETSSPLTWLEGLDLVTRDGNGHFVLTAKATPRLV